MARYLIWYGNDDIDRDRRIESTNNTDTRGSNNHYVFASASDEPKELLMMWLSCPDACNSCMELKFDECKLAGKNNYWSSHTREFGGTQPLYVNMSIKIPNVLIPEEEKVGMDEESEHEEVAKEDPEAQGGDDDIVVGQLPDIKDSSPYQILDDFTGVLCAHCKVCHVNSANEQTVG